MSGVARICDTPGSIQLLLTQSRDHLEINCALVKQCIEEQLAPWNGEAIANVMHQPDILRLADVHSVACASKDIMAKTLEPIASDSKWSPSEIAQVSEKLIKWKTYVGSVPVLLGLLLDDGTDEQKDQKTKYCKNAVAACRSQHIALPAAIKELMISIVGEAAFA